MSRPKGSKNKETESNIVNEENDFQAYASVNEIQTQYLKLNYPDGLSTFSGYTVPKDYLNQVKEAKRLRSIDIVDRILAIRKNYTLPIRGFKCKLKKQQKFYDEYVLPLVQRFAKQWIVEKYSIGECFAHYGFISEKIPMYLRLEDPENIKVTEFMGFESYEIKLGAGIKEQIRKLQEQGAIDKLPGYLRKAINNTGVISNKIVLDKSNMYRTTDGKQDYETNVIPPLIKIAKQLNLRSFLTDVDYSNAFAAQKSSIIHTKCGDKETYKQWDKDKIKDIHDLVTNRPPGQAFITTRYDVDMEQVNIDLNQLFDPKKFEQVNCDIMDFMGIPIVFVPSKSGELNNSVVVISLKPMEESINTDRQIFEEFLRVYFKEVNRRNGFMELPQILYKKVNIRGDNELLKELEFLSNKGVLSFQDLSLYYDFDYEEQLEKKAFDKKNRELIAPVYENSQGLQPQLEEAVEQQIRINNSRQTNTENNQNKKKPNKNASDDS